VKALLDTLYAPGDQRKRILRIGQRQQIVEVALAGGAPAEVLGYEDRLYPFHERRKPLEMSLVPGKGGAESQPYAVKADRIVGANPLQHVQVMAARAEVVLAVDLQPVHGLARRREFGVMRRAQPNPRAQAQLLSFASFPAWPCTRLPPIFSQVPLLTALKSFGS
jgi:hypothetical protein